MRALVQDRYGSPETLRVASVPKPSVGEGEVLVRVHAASLNPRDWHLMRGEPRLARLLDRRTFGREAPREPIWGTDFAGVVQAVGAGVTRCRPGDAVFGEAPGAIAELVAAPEQQVATVPAGWSFVQAAVVPLAANTALTCLDAADPSPGQSLLVNGASGGVGTFLVQLAAERGLLTTAVCSAGSADLVRALRARDVIDYTRQDFSRSGEKYDVVVDLVGNCALRDLRRAVRRDGTLVLSGGGVSGQGRHRRDVLSPHRTTLATAVGKVRTRPGNGNIRRPGHGHHPRVRGCTTRAAVTGPITVDVPASARPWKES